MDRNRDDLQIEEEEEQIEPLEIQIPNNVEEEEEYQDVTTKLYHLFNFVTLVSLISAIIFIFTFGSPEPFYTAKSIFVICVCLFHLLAIFVKIRQLEKLNDPFSFFISNCDLHYLIILAMYAITDLMPILCVLFYIINFVYELLSYLSNNLKIFFGEDNRKKSKKLKSIASNAFFNNAPAILDMINIVYLLIVSIVRLSILCFLTLFVFIIDIIMYNYAISKQYKNVWSNFAKWVNRNLGILSPIVSFISQIGALSEKMYS